MVDVLLVVGPDGMRYKATQVAESNEWKVVPFSMGTNPWVTYKSSWWSGLNEIKRLWNRDGVFVKDTTLSDLFSVLAKTISHVDLREEANARVWYD